MPIIRGQYYSNYRLSKMLQSREEAMELRGWDRFCELTGLFGKGLQKKQQLTTLYDQLHHEIENDNIKRLITFNKMRKLVNDNDNPNPVEFRVELHRLNGLSSDISYKIGNYTLLTKSCMLLEEQVISELSTKNYIDNQGKLADNLEETTITFINKNFSRDQKSIDKRILFGLPNINGNDCFISSAIQFILNNEALIKACTNHPNKKFSQGIKKLIDGNLDNKSLTTLYTDLIKNIRDMYIKRGDFSQDSAPMLLQRLFAHNPHILLVKKTSEEELSLKQDDVFQKLDNFINDSHLLRIINDFPIEIVEDSGNTRCPAYDNLKEFVSRNSTLSKFTILFDNKNFLEFKEDLLKSQDQLSLLKELIELNKSSEFTWIDSSGFGFKYDRYGNSVREKFLVYSQIPDNTNLNTIIVHSGTVNSGHYICYVKKEHNWFLCNDSQITKVPDIEKSIGKKNIVAYNYKVENKSEKIPLRYQDPFYWKLEPQCDIEDLMT